MKTQKTKSRQLIGDDVYSWKRRNVGVSQTVTEKAKRYSYLNMPRRPSTINLKSHLTFLCKKIDNKFYLP